AFIGHHTRRRICVAHRKYIRAHSERAANLIGDFSQRYALTKLMRAMNMSGQVSVAKVEPPTVIVAGKQLQTLECIARQSPAGFLIDQTGKRVCNRVEVGTDSKAE